ncbi:unnamed protein product [Ilex paraguariensis]|uniref:Kinesin motor domain-containing protein n=1 Tax=Ilex paraguariensis TaxID=185542 RepID=A0ABC8TML5_9AQUA
MDNLKSKQHRRGSFIPLSLCQNVWSSEKSTRDSRSNDDNGVNVQVILRCRPLIEDEVRVTTPMVVSCNEPRREVSVNQITTHKQIDRTFMFDKVFGPTSQQKDLYDQVVSPIITEALEGYTCTIFAYGQTGTGKTYTMEGEGRKEKNGEFHKDAGVIPRAVQQIFDILVAQNAEYSMKVTFLELYNEEITDLLAPDDNSKFCDDKSKKPIALMDDGKGTVFVRGLEEEIVCTADEIYKILEKGSAKKHTAETLLNKQSNRSHSIFSITVQIKECTAEGVELIKCGKLNLVDLAGSENILRSGRREGRAREAGEINKSLLTLGRVINALVEHSGHVPYRDSKLTRLLRDSLGGKTKTCIIATVSPSVHCLEETLGTLDYAFRAKSIQNRPEVNQKVIKSALIKDLYLEIDRLKQELHATREKNGIYIPRDRYLSEEAAKKAMAEKLGRLELDSKFKDKQLMDLRELYIYQQQLTTDLSEKLERTQGEFEQTEQALFDLDGRFRQANDTIKEKEYLIFNLLGSEKALTERAFELQAELENAASEMSILFTKIEHKNNMEDRNRILIQNFHSGLAQQLEVLNEAVVASVTQQEQQLKVIEQNTLSFLPAKAGATAELQTQLRKLQELYGSGIKTLDDVAGELDQNSLLTCHNLKSEVSKNSSCLGDLIREISLEAKAILNDLQINLTNQGERVAAFAQQQHESCSRTYQATQSISRLTVNFFKTLSMHVSKLTLVVAEEETIEDQKLCALEKKFEEYTANEERQILDKVAELLASSNARMKNMVQTAVDDLRECTSSRTSKLHQEMSNMQDLTSSAKGEWTSYLGKTETQYIEDTTSVVNGKDGLEEGLRQCMTKARLIAEQWRKAQDSALSLQRRNIDSVDTIVQNGVEGNQKIKAQFSAVVSSTLGESDVANINLLSSVEDLLRLDQYAFEKINSLIGPSCEAMKEAEISHFHIVSEIMVNAGKCLMNDYMVDGPSCSTPRKRAFNIPTMACIEDLRTPAFEGLLKSFREAGLGRQANGKVNNHQECMHPFSPSAPEILSGQLREELEQQNLQ